MENEHTVDINRATKEELVALPGIGEVLAERIIAARPFAAVEALAQVEGISQSLLEKLAPRLTVSPLEEPLAEDEAEPVATAEAAPHLGVSEGEEEDAGAPESEEEADALPSEDALAEEAPEGEGQTEADETSPLEGEEAPAPREAVAAPPSPPAPAEEARYITRRGAWTIALITGIVGFLLAFALSLGVLQALNGTLYYADAGRYSATVRHVQALEETVNQMQMQVQTLQRQLADLKAVSSRVDQLADDQQALQSQVDDLQTTIADIQTSTEKFNAFFDGLRDLLNDLEPSATATPSSTPTAEPTATPTP